MKLVKNYILLVDSYRRPSRQRNTAGRYRVGAKNPDEAVRFLREKIGFGAIQVYYECKPDDKLNIAYKMVVQETFDGNQIVHVDTHHANAPQKNKN